MIGIFVLFDDDWFLEVYYISDGKTSHPEVLSDSGYHVKLLQGVWQSFKGLNIRILGGIKKKAECAWLARTTGTVGLHGAVG